MGEDGRPPSSPDDTLPLVVWSQLQGVLCGDSSAAIAISNRRGCGKLRHIHVGELWIQEKVHNKGLFMKKVDGVANPADLFTKHLAADKSSSCCSSLSCRPRMGRAEKGLHVQVKGYHTDANTKICSARKVDDVQPLSKLRHALPAPVSANPLPFGSGCGKLWFGIEQ